MPDLLVKDALGFTNKMEYSGVLMRRSHRQIELIV